MTNENVSQEETTVATSSEIKGPQTTTTTTTTTSKKKKNQQKNKVAAAAANKADNASGAVQAEPTGTTTSNADEAPTTTTGKGAITITPSEAEMQNVKSMVEQLKLNPNFLPNLRSSAKTAEEALAKPYKFWSTQPVPKLGETVEGNESIEPNKEISEIQVEPDALPDAFKWDTLNLNDPLVLTELYTLLNENYVEDDDAMFRFDYQPDFLKWALQPPGWRADWHVGVRVAKSGLMVGFISAIPGHVWIYDKLEKIVEINFLCVHKKLRSKRLAPVLIKEITRRVHLTGIFQAVYTAGVVLPKPVATCRYWHRSLNPKKLIEVEFIIFSYFPDVFLFNWYLFQIKFSHLSRNMTMQRTIKLYKLPDSPKTPGYRALTDKDLPAAHKLLNAYLEQFTLKPAFDADEFRHWFSPQNGIICSYVVEDPVTHQITDLISYYTLPSTVMHHAVHNQVKAAYSFYNVSTKTPWLDLMNDALISAKNANFDVFNALDLMENRKFLQPLKFGIGDGNLQYYLYNWRCPNMAPEEVGLILL